MKRTSLIAAITLGLVATSLMADTYEEQINSMSRSLANSAIRDAKKKIAVMALTDLKGHESELGSFLAEALTDNLINIGISNKAFTVVDRDHLKVILAEQKIALTGIMNPETVKKLGQVSGADAFIIGNITELSDEFSISTKLIAAETAENLGADRRKLTKTQELVKLWGSEAGQKAAAQGATTKNTSKSPTAESNASMRQGIWEGKCNGFFSGGWRVGSTMRLNVERVDGPNVTGQINFPESNNTTVQVVGQVVSSFGDFLEQTRWQFAAKQTKARDGKWLKMKTTKGLAGHGVSETVELFVEIKEDSLVGCWFIGNGSSPEGGFEIRYSEQ